MIAELSRQAPYIQQEQLRYRSPRDFQHWANHLAYAALIEAGAEVMNELADPIRFWAATTCRWARIFEAPPRFLTRELAEVFRRTPSPRLDDELPQVLPCFRLMLPGGALFTEDGLPIPVVIVADLRAMADWLPAEAQRIRGISCVGLALDGASYLTRHPFQQIGERQPTVEDLSHSAWQWDEQSVQSTNQRMEGLAINALLVQLYQPELLTTGPAAKVPSGKGFSAGSADETGPVKPQGPVSSARTSGSIAPLGPHHWQSFASDQLQLLTPTVPAAGAKVQHLAAIAQPCLRGQLTPDASWGGLHPSSGAHPCWCCSGSRQLGQRWLRC